MAGAEECDTVSGMQRLASKTMHLSRNWKICQLHRSAPLHTQDVPIAANENHDGARSTRVPPKICKEISYKHAQWS